VTPFELQCYRGPVDAHTSHPPQRGNRLAAHLCGCSQRRARFRGTHSQMNRLRYLWVSRAPLWAARRYWRGDPVAGAPEDILWHFIIDSRESARRIAELEYGRKIRAAKAAMRKELGLLAFPIFVSVRSFFRSRG